MVFNFKTVLQSLLSVFYPPLCVHCQKDVGQRRILLCTHCRDQIELIDTTQRCRICFAMQSKGPCARCLERQVVIHRQMAACEALGPMLTLKNGIQQGKREMILAAASLMAYQWLEQKMPLPDILIPLPVSFWQKQRQGFDSHLLLAQEIGKILSIPILNLLKMKTDWETFLAEGKFEERFYFKSPDSLCDRHLLLIHPLLEDTKFRKAAEALKAHFPGRIDALAFTDH